jgi:hypothetical protein
VNPVLRAAIAAGVTGSLIEIVSLLMILVVMPATVTSDTIAIPTFAITVVVMYIVAPFGAGYAGGYISGERNAVVGSLAGFPLAYMLIVTLTGFVHFTDVWILAAILAGQVVVGHLFAIRGHRPVLAR